MQFFSTEVNDTNVRSLTKFRIGLGFITSSNKHISTHWTSTVPRSSYTVLETISLLNKILMEMMVSTMYIRPHEFIVLSPNIDVFYVEYGKVRLTPNDRTHLYIHWRLETTS